ncbi:MAG: ABC transporter permease subunit [Chloroflexi bacterium]|nr:ABC transporter permease subunit [Chloroflexota bacterium]
MQTEKGYPLIELIKAHLRAGELSKAKQVAEHLIAKHPQVLEGWLFMAGLSDPEEALVYLARANEIVPDDHRVKEARAWAIEAVRTTPSEPFPTQARTTQPEADDEEQTVLTRPGTHRPPPSRQEEPRWALLNRNGFFRGLVHLGKKALLILLTIFIGTFITIHLMNRDVVTGLATSPAQLDAVMERQVERAVKEFTRENHELSNLPPDEQAALLEAFREEMITEIGLSLPKFQRHLKWTVYALTFNWGRFRAREHTPFAGLWRPQRLLNLNEIILEYLPNTLLLITTAYLLVLLLGLPLALVMSRNYNQWYDKLFSFFATLSSIPSWVYGIILIAIFALELQWLPTGRMVGNLPPETRWGYILVVLRHMILPVLAIFLSIFFNLVYSWRTFFITFSSEDYVELGKATGISNRKLQRDYILKPTLPYVITSFALMFATFWQMTLALEVVFNWPGLGWLYIVIGLPNLWGESVYPGDLVIAISLVVLFAYLMGSIVLMLDFFYVLVDPRIRFSIEGENMHLKKQKRDPRLAIKRLFRLKKRAPMGFGKTQAKPCSWNETQKPKFCADASGHSGKRPFWKQVKRALKEMLRYPSAIIGFAIIGVLLMGSLYAVIFLPYENIGDDWSQSTFIGQPKTPKLAKPAWTNLFVKGKYLSTLILDSKQGDGTHEVNQLNGDANQVIVTFTFDYDYAAFPSEMFLYLSSNFDEKRGFASVIWRTPDGREMELKTTEVANLTYYDFENGIQYRRWVRDNPNWAVWFDVEDITQNAPHYLLFSDPNQTAPSVVRGTYELVIDGFTFEEGSDIQVELVLLGQVYGAAGTDFYRRDLSVPLLWGMPFALLIGLSGALFTTIVSMALAATGVWFGGWIDNFIQRLIDVNLVLPILAIAVMAYAFLGVGVWTILVVYVFLNAFGTPTKTFRSAFLQVKEAPYIQAARAYGAKNSRIILKYMIPRLIPILVPQLVILIPAFVFLEATLGFFNIRMLYPTWGTVIYQAAMRGGIFGSRFWMLQPIALLLLTGLGFSLFGLALERILNPRLSED